MPSTDIDLLNDLDNERREPSNLTTTSNNNELLPGKGKTHLLLLRIEFHPLTDTQDGSPVATLPDDKNQGEVVVIIPPENDFRRQSTGLTNSFPLPEDNKILTPLPTENTENVDTSVEGLPEPSEGETLKKQSDQW